MAVNIPLIPVTLASLVLESCFYGIFFLLSVTSFWLLLQRDVPGKSLARSTLLSPYFVGTVALSVFITGHWVMSIYRVFQAFIYFDNGTFPLGFLGNLGHFSETLKNSFFVANIATGDTLIVHRLWTVWGFHKGVIVFPVCTLLGLLVCSGQLVYQLSQFRPGEDIFLSVAGRWVRTDTILTLITNSYCTALISWRLWTASKVGVQPHRGANIKARSSTQLRIVLTRPSAHPIHRYRKCHPIHNLEPHVLRLLRDSKQPPVHLHRLLAGDDGDRFHSYPCSRGLGWDSAEEAAVDHIVQIRAWALELHGRHPACGSEALGDGDGNGHAWL